MRGKDAAARSPATSDIRHASRKEGEGGGLEPIVTPFRVNLGVPPHLGLGARCKGTRLADTAALSLYLSISEQEHTRTYLLQERVHHPPARKTVLYASQLSACCAWVLSVGQGARW